MSLTNRFDTNTSHSVSNDLDSSDSSFGSQVEISDWLAEESPSKSKFKPSGSFAKKLFSSENNDDDDVDCSDKENQTDNSHSRRSSGRSEPLRKLEIPSLRDQISYYSHESFTNEDIKVVLVPDSAYIRSHLDEFSALCEVDDLNFASKSVEEQESILRTMEIIAYTPGDVIIPRGDTSADFYIVVATQESSRDAFVVVERDGTVITHLYRGQYFGQMQFLTGQKRARNATIRASSSLHGGSIKIARIAPHYFERWSFFRMMLMVKAVPFLSQLPCSDRQDLIRLTQITHYSNGEYIIRQGDDGDRFYIILDGTARVVENGATGEADGVDLATIRSGHCFGEIALTANVPRVANVLAVGSTTCLSLTKEKFKQVLGGEAFSGVVQELLKNRERTRRHREIVRKPSKFGDISDNAVLGEFQSPMQAHGILYPCKRTPDTNKQTHALVARKTPGSAHLARRSLSEPIDIPVTETKIFSVSKLKSGDRCVNDKYLLEKEIGSGSFGDVYKVRDLNTKTCYAMKRLNRALVPRTSIGADISGEMEIMKRLKNDYVVQLFEVIDDPSTRKLYLIQELMDGPLLPDSLQCAPLGAEDCRRYFRDIVCGVHYLHAMGIIHRDIKPQNILVSHSQKRAKIGDLGAAVLTGGNECGKFNGTPAYTAPELNIPKENRLHNFSCMPCIDLFAMGATLFCMSTGHPPWMADTELGLAEKIRHLEPKLPAQTDPHLRHLVGRLLDKNWSTRADMDVVINDAWVTEEGSDPLFDCYHEEEDWDTVGAVTGKETSKLDITANNIAKEVLEGSQDENLMMVSPRVHLDKKRRSERPHLALMPGTKQVSVDEYGENVLQNRSLSRKMRFQTLPKSSSVPLATLEVRAANVAQRRQRRLKSLHESRILSRTAISKKGSSSSGNIQKELIHKNMSADTGIGEQETSPVFATKETISNQISSDPSNNSNDTSSDDDDDEDYGEIAEVQGMEIFDELITPIISEPVEMHWDCVVGRDGSIDPADAERGCVSPMRMSRDSASPESHSRKVISPNAVMDTLTHLHCKDPSSSFCANLNIRVAACSNQGGRTYMEDRTCISIGTLDDVSSKFNHFLRSPLRAHSRPATAVSVIGVFDGHNGSYVAEQLSQQVPEVLRSTLKTNDYNAVDALRRTCFEMDRRVLTRDYHRMQAQRQNRGLSAQTFGGSTGLLAVIQRQESSDDKTGSITLTIANVGDCRAVKSSGGHSQQITRDHKASDSVELERIRKAGGEVTNGRVAGVLAVSRSFGDQAVTSEPQLVQLQIEEDDEFVLIATDGLWDLFSNEEAVNFIRFKLLEHADCNKATEQLVAAAAIRAGRAALQGKSWDNISVILCAVNQAGSS
eukprot:GSChrysophyteH1.ASY1.ANO1.2330.1 assembled CDS